LNTNKPKVQYRIGTNQQRQSERVKKQNEIERERGFRFAKPRA
jgi:hypothetical protein